MRAEPARLAGLAAALLWTLTCLRWFDVGPRLRPPVLDAVPVHLLALGTAAAIAVWLRARWALLRGPRGGGSSSLWLVLALTVAFRLPVAMQGAAAAVTPDGALSGIVALHVRNGIERLVFVPHVPYSGSLKSHVAALLGLVLDPARAFALSSVLFYALFVAAAFGLAVRWAGPRTAWLAGLYLAFAPPFVTRYSLSNDGNYVEVLALGTLALLLAARWVEETRARPLLALAAGLLLGLAFWCHILAVIHLAAIGLVFVLYGRLASLRSGLALAGGWVLGYVPGLLWNVANGWESFHYLVPGEADATARDALAWPRRLWTVASDYGPVLMGYDPGYGPTLDALLHALAVAALLAMVVAAGLVLPRARRVPGFGVLAVFAATNLALAAFALPHVPGNPRYVLFLAAPFAVWLAEAYGTGARRIVLAVLIPFGALGSLAHVPGTLAADARWREFVAALERDGVRHCYTDFHLATRINFLSAERVVCTAKLGPITTEYFFAYREQVEAAPDAAFVAVNRHSASRLASRLDELGVRYERRELLKPVLLRLSRKVDPEELFPGRAFPWR